MAILELSERLPRTQTLTTPSFNTRVAQHCTAISATAELFFHVSDLNINLGDLQRVKAQLCFITRKICWVYTIWSTITLFRVSTAVSSLAILSSRSRSASLTCNFSVFASCTNCNRQHTRTHGIFTFKHAQHWVMNTVQCRVNKLRKQ